MSELLIFLLNIPINVEKNLRFLRHKFQIALKKKRATGAPERSYKLPGEQLIRKTENWQRLCMLAWMTCTKMEFVKKALQLNRFFSSTIRLMLNTQSSPDCGHLVWNSRLWTNKFIFSWFISHNHTRNND